MPRLAVVRFFVGLLCAWALLMIVPDLIRPFAPLATLGLQADFGGRIVSVEPGGPAAEAGVRAGSPGHGDRIDFVKTPRQTLFTLYSGFGGRPYVVPGRRVPLAIITPDGAQRDVVLTALQREPPIIERASLLFNELLGIGFIVLGTLLAWHFPTRRDVGGFFLYAIWFNPGQNYVFYALLPSTLWVTQEVLSAVVQAAGLAGFVVFALRFPTDRAEGRRRWAELALPALVVGLALLTLVGSGAEFGRPNRSAWLLAFWTKAAVYPLIVAAFLTKLQRLSAVDRQRLRLVIFGCIPGLLFYLLAESTEATSLWQPVFDRLNWLPPGAWLNGAYLVNALVPISIGYAVVRQRVLPIDFIVNRGLTLGIVWAAVAMAAEAIVLTAHRFLEENHVLSALIIAAILVAAAPVLEHFKERINHLIDRLLFVRLHAARRGLDRIAQRLTDTTTPAEIEAAIVAAPCEQLALTCAALFALDDDGAFRLAANVRWPRDAVPCLRADDRILQGVRERTSSDVLREHADMPTGAAQPQVVLALAPNDAVEAVAIFSGHSNGSALTPDEIVILEQFVRRCGAIRAHAVALAMRRELIALRAALTTLSGRDTLTSNLPVDAESAG